jgi:hypothetical protein
VLIILEGVDRTGKTTLASFLAEAIDAPVIHKGPPSATDGITEYLAPLSGYRPGSGRHLICDRWHWGEMIWPKIFTRDALLDKRMFLYIENVLDELGAVMVHCDGNAGQIYKRITSSDDEWLSDRRSHFLEALYRFRIIASSSILPVIHYDFSWMTLEDTLQTIKTRAGIRETECCMD